MQDSDRTGVSLHSHFWHLQQPPAGSLIAWAIQQEEIGGGGSEGNGASIALVCRGLQLLAATLRSLLRTVQKPIKIWHLEGNPTSPGMSALRLHVILAIWKLLRSQTIGPHCPAVPTLTGTLPYASICREGHKCHSDFIK